MFPKAGSWKAAELRIDAQVSVTRSGYLPLSRNGKLAACVKWCVDGFFWIVIIFQLESEYPWEGCALFTSGSPHSLLVDIG